MMVSHMCRGTHQTFSFEECFTLIRSFSGQKKQTQLQQSQQQDAGKSHRFPSVIGNKCNIRQFKLPHITIAHSFSCKIAYLLCPVNWADFAPILIQFAMLPMEKRTLTNESALLSFLRFRQMQETTMHCKRKETARGNVSLFSWETRNARSSATLLLSNRLLPPNPSVCIHSNHFMDKANNILIWDKCRHNQVKCLQILPRRSSIQVQLFFHHSPRNHLLCRKDVWGGHVISQSRNLIGQKNRKNKINRLLQHQNHPKHLVHIRFRCRVFSVLFIFL